MKKIKSIISLLMVLTFMPFVANYSEAASTVYKEFYVSNGGENGNGTQNRPFPSIAEAITALSGVVSGMTGDIVVYLANGTYEIPETLVFNSLNTGKKGYNVIFKAVEGASPVISGGKKIKGSDPDWKKYDTVNGKWIYRYPLDNNKYRQLYVNGEPAVRARSKGNEGIRIRTVPATNSKGEPFNKVVGAFIADSTVADWIVGTEAVFIKQFYAPICQIIDKVETEGGFNLSFSTETINNINSPEEFFTETDSPVYIENALELLDEPGEWYHDTNDGFLYYIPSGITIKTLTFELPILEKLLTFNNGASNIKFEGISFENSSWNFPNEKGGYVPKQNAYTPGNNFLYSAAVEIDASNNISFDNCAFRKLGGAGLNLKDGAKNISVTNSTFNNITGAAANLGELTNGFPDESDLNENITFEHNDIYDCCLGLKAASGIGIGFLQNSSVSHNTIHNLPYSGIHIGWGWNNTEHITNGLKIKNNHIYDVMQELEDGGAIYTLGGSNPNSSYTNEIAGNYIERVHNYGGAIYNDNGSFGWHVHHNVVDLEDIDCDDKGVSWYFANSGTHDNLLESNFTSVDKHFVSASGIDNLISEGNIIDENAVWNSTALDIIKNAGAGASATITPLYERFDDTTTSMSTVISDECVVLSDGGTVNAPFGSNGIMFEVLPLGTPGTLSISVAGPGNQLNIKSGSLEWLNSGNVVSNETLTSYQENVATRVLLYTDGTKCYAEIGTEKFEFDLTGDVTGYEISYAGGRLAIGKIRHNIELYTNYAYNADFNSGNLLENGGFETTTITETGWRVGGVSISRSTDYSREGIASLKVNDGGGGYVLSPSVSLSPSKFYKLSADIYVDKLNGLKYAEDASVNFNLLTSKSSNFCAGEDSTSYATNFWGKNSTLNNKNAYKHNDTMKLNKGWNRISTYFMPEIELPDAQFTIRFTDSNDKVYYIDNFRLEEVNTNVSENFENGVGDFATYKCTISHLPDNTYGESKGSMKFEQTEQNGDIFTPVYVEKGHKYKIRFRAYNAESTEHPAFIRLVSTLKDRATASVIDGNVERASEKTMKPNEWTTIERTYTAGETRLVYVGFISQSPGTKTYYIDDFSFVDTAGDTAELDNMYNVSAGTATSVGAGEVKFTPSGNSDIFANLFTIEVGRKYALSAEVSTISGTANAKIGLKPHYSYPEIDMLTASDNMTLENDAFVESNSSVVTATDWTTVSDYVVINSDDVAAFDADFFVKVTDTDGTAVPYNIRNIKLTPVEDGKNAILYDVWCDNSVVGFSEDGLNNYTALGYRYISESGSVIGSGYVYANGELPSGANAKTVELYPITLDGERGISVRSSKTYANSNTVVNEISANSTKGYLRYSNTDNDFARMPALFITAEYVNANPSLLDDAVVTETNIHYGRYIEETNIVDAGNPANIFKSFFWTKDGIRPIATIN